MREGEGARKHGLGKGRIGGSAELLRAFSRRRSRGPVPRTLGPMPARGALHVPARLDRAALDALVLPDLDFLRLLRTLLFGPRRNLRLVQRGVGGGPRRRCFRLARLALGELALALL